MTLYYRIKVPIFEWLEQRWVKKNFYHDPVFKALDQELLAGPNPYHAAKVFPYGETPLRALYAMAQAINLKPTDHFVDLGCGRGRAVFFLSHFFGCKATGIDLTPSFIKRARRLNKSDKVEFLCKDFLTYDFKGATCVYLYGITYSVSCIKQLEEKLIELPNGSRIVTVSEPLLQMIDYETIDVRFNWGFATIYYCCKNNTKDLN